MSSKAVSKKLIATFSKMLENGRDDALLRYSLGTAFLRSEMYQEAIFHLHEAIEHKPDYSAAYKSLAKAYQQISDHNSAIEIYEKGICVAQQSGDKQAEKEMKVFLRRLRKLGEL